MHEQFQQQDFSDVDFSFVYELDETTLNFFFEVTDFAIESMREMIEQDEYYLSNLTPEQVIEIRDYYEKLLNLYTDYELFEECEGILFVIHTMENLVQEVGNVN
jgi:hypothetical protein